MGSFVIPALGAQKPTEQQGAGKLPGATMPVPSHKVKPGDAPFTNGDVTVTNGTDKDGNPLNSRGDATVTPEDGNANSSSTVTTDRNFKGTITGVETGDTVIVGNDNDADVGTTGGRVELGRDCFGTTVSNSSTIPGSNPPVPNTQPTYIKMPGQNQWETIPPGSSINIVRPPA
jgi:phosphohistidine swiveling domain-containing protein